MFILYLASAPSPLWGTSYPNWILTLNLGVGEEHHSSWCETGRKTTKKDSVHWQTFRHLDWHWHFNEHKLVLMQNAEDTSEVLWVKTALLEIYAMQITVTNKSAIRLKPTAAMGGMCVWQRNLWTSDTQKDLLYIEEKHLFLRPPTQSQELLC